MLRNTETVLIGLMDIYRVQLICQAQSRFAVRSRLEYLCNQNLSLTFGDETVKIILNTKGTMDDVSLEMKRLLEYIDGQAASDEFTKELEDAV